MRPTYLLPAPAAALTLWFGLAHHTTDRISSSPTPYPGAADLDCGSAWFPADTALHDTILSKLAGQSIDISGIECANVLVAYQTLTMGTGLATILLSLYALYSAKTKKSQLVSLYSLQ